MNINNAFLFPYIYDTPESKKIEELLKKILVRADKFRMKIEEAAKVQSEDIRNLTESVERINWHNETREYLKELNENKYDLYTKLRSYF
jgi:hypothetical protein